MKKFIIGSLVLILPGSIHADLTQWDGIYECHATYATGFQDIPEDTWPVFSPKIEEWKFVLRPPTGSDSEYLESYPYLLFRKGFAELISYCKEGFASYGWLHCYGDFTFTFNAKQGRFSAAEWGSYAYGDEVVETFRDNAVFTQGECTKLY